MHHLFLEIEPKYLGLSPYVPGRQNSIHIKAKEIGLKINPKRFIYWLPVNGGWVKPDNVAVQLLTQIYKQTKNLLVIDIGTKRKIILGNKEKALSTSTAAGSTFEE